MLALYPGYAWTPYTHTLLLKRNFFGVLRARDEGTERLLFFDTTIHGAQALDERFKKTPLTYFAPTGPAGDVFDVLNQREGSQTVAVLGLGLGSVSCYARPGQRFDFYEIDPDVVKIAQDPKLFTFLSGCGADYKILMGDARLNLEKAPDHSYDLIFVDTFSSDNVPIHMMTEEAFRLYFKKLKPGGLLAVNITNKYLDLGQVVAAIAGNLRVSVMFRSTPMEVLYGSLPVAATNYAVLAEGDEYLSAFPAHGWRLREISPSWKSWRDDYSDIVSVLKLP